jgi:hypothetical protein
MDEVDGLIRVHARRTRARRAAELELLRAAQAAAPPKLYQVEVQAPTMAEGDGYGGKWHTEGLFETSAELVEACNKLNQIFPAERIRITWNGETDD